MKTLLTSGAAAFALHLGIAQALPPTFAIDGLFSSADGSIQYVEIVDQGSQDCDANEDRWKGLRLTATGPAGTKEYAFPANLPSCRTSKKHILVATQGFADLGIVAPDFVMPGGFLPQPAGSLAFAGIADLGYNGLPVDGATALDAANNPVPALAINLAGASARVMVAPIAPVVEYYNAALDHYFISWGTTEIAILDEGVKIKGWVRTQGTFKTSAVAQAATSPVCRFYIPPALGDSHFFGRGTAECDATAAKFPELVLEDSAFMHMTLPQQGVCPAGTINVYRVFSNRADANHRYTTDPAVRDAMKAKGWIPEGDGPDLVVMCAPA